MSNLQVSWHANDFVASLIQNLFHPQVQDFSLEQCQEHLEILNYDLIDSSSESYSCRLAAVGNIHRISYLRSCIFVLNDVQTVQVRVAAAPLT